MLTCANTRHFQKISCFRASLSQTQNSRLMPLTTQINFTVQATTSPASPRRQQYGVLCNRCNSKAAANNPQNVRWCLDKKDNNQWCPLAIPSQLAGIHAILVHAYGQRMLQNRCQFACSHGRQVPIPQEWRRLWRIHDSRTQDRPLQRSC